MAATTMEVATMAPGAMLGSTRAAPLAHHALRGSTRTRLGSQELSAHRVPQAGTARLLEQRLAAPVVFACPGTISQQQARPRARSVPSGKTRQRDRQRAHQVTLWLQRQLRVPWTTTAMCARPGRTRVERRVFRVQEALTRPKAPLRAPPAQLDSTRLTRRPPARRAPLGTTLAVGTLTA